VHVAKSGGGTSPAVTYDGSAEPQEQELPPLLEEQVQPVGGRAFWAGLIQIGVNAYTLKLQQEKKTDNGKSKPLFYVNEILELAFKYAGISDARCAFSDRNLHSMMRLVPTPARLKLLQACDQ
jgi:hypothetical protein